MRTDKELLEILLKHVGEGDLLPYGAKGLCYIRNVLLREDLITMYEHIRLGEIIYNSIEDAPWYTRFLPWLRKPYQRSYGYNLHFWKVERAEPRRRYIDWLLKNVV